MKIDFFKNMFFQNESENKYSQELRKILKKSKFPVLICSFERPYYLKIMIKQLNKLKIKPIVLDNNSKDIKLVSFLKKNNRKKFYLIRLNQNYKNIRHLQIKALLENLLLQEVQRAQIHLI